MKKSIFAAVLAGILVLTGCSNESKKSNSSVENISNEQEKNVIDYGDAESFETALNEGKNLEGKIVRFVAGEFHPNSAWGYNVWAGEHLNFVSSEHPDIQEGDTVVVKVTTVKNALGSWIINYEKVENAAANDNTIFNESNSSVNNIGQNITPQNVEDDDVVMAQVVLNILFNSVDDVYTASNTNKELAQCIFFTTVCYLDKKDGTDYYHTYQNVIPQVLFNGNNAEEELGMVSAAYNTLKNGKLHSAMSDSYEMAKENIKTFRSASSSSKIELKSSKNLSSIAASYYFLCKNIPDKYQEDIQYRCDDTILTIARVFYGLDVSDRDIQKAEDNMEYLFNYEFSTEGSDNSQPTSQPETSSSESQSSTSQPTQSTPSPSVTPTTGERNALKKAQSYLDFTAFSSNGLIGQLEYDGFKKSEATYGADNVGANWNEQAVKKAKSYLDFTAFSYNGLIEQLEFEEFTHEQAVYGADKCGADWNEQAAKKAKSYLDFMAFSREGLIEQLEFEGFTHEQAVYGVTQNGY